MSVVIKTDLRKARGRVGGAVFLGALPRPPTVLTPTPKLPGTRPLCPVPESSVSSPVLAAHSPSIQWNPIDGPTPTSIITLTSPHSRQ